MSILPRALLQSQAPESQLWPGSPSDAQWATLEARFERLPGEVREALASAMIDPERNPWARAAYFGLEMAESAGCRSVGMLTDELVGMVNAQGEAFGLVALGFQLRANRWGEAAEVSKLMARLDATFGEQCYVLYLRQPVPPGIDVGGIGRAVGLWLAAVGRGERNERHAVYEDGGVAFELTLTGTRVSGGGCPRVLTVGPVDCLERLAKVDTRLIDAIVLHEESVGEMPLVAVMGADHPWALSRGYLEQLLYGTAEFVEARREGSDRCYRAGFRANGRSLFSDPSCRQLAAIWLVEPNGGPLDTQSLAFDNPWAREPMAMTVSGPRFASVGVQGVCNVLRWETR